MLQARGPAYAFAIAHVDHPLPVLVGRSAPATELAVLDLPFVRRAQPEIGHREVEHPEQDVSKLGRSKTQEKIERTERRRKDARPAEAAVCEPAYQSAWEQKLSRRLEAPSARRGWSFWQIPVGGLELGLAPGVDLGPVRLVLQQRASAPSP